MTKGAKFALDQDIPDRSGKVVFITGATAGIGKTTILDFAKHNPEHVYFIGRSVSSAAEVPDQVKAISPSLQITFIECDLASLASVSEAADRFIRSSERLDLLICNAGVFASTPGLTKDEYEVDFGTNHLGHALLVKLLLPTLLRREDQPGDDARILILSYELFRLHPKGGIKFEELRSEQENRGL